MVITINLHKREKIISAEQSQDFYDKSKHNGKSFLNCISVAPPAQAVWAEPKAKLLSPALFAAVFPTYSLNQNNSVPQPQ